MRKTSENLLVYPYVRAKKGDKKMWNISPEHGRSYLVDYTKNKRYVISKGNGLNHTQFSFLNTGEMGDGTWGLLLEDDAIRDFTVGQEVANLDIKTNKMEYVVLLEIELQVQNKVINPILLQYSVECPYRISDAYFIPPRLLWKEVHKWEKLNKKRFSDAHMIAADVLLRNLQILHSNGILHNAISKHNYTWALELLDFELSHTPKFPYKRKDYVRYVPSLFSREVQQTYEIISYISWVLNECINFKKLDFLFKKHGFQLDDYSLTAF